MRTSRTLTSMLLALTALVLMSAAALAADPGLIYPASSEVSDQKAGSLLIYNYYTSNTANANTSNTRVNITNTSTTSPVAVHLFFVGSACAIADVYICLTQNQTASFLASDIDPGFSGYIVAFAVSTFTGCPITFNFLIGDEFIKDGARQANLGAEAFAAVGPLVTGCTDASPDTLLSFTGLVGSYNRAPRVLAVSSLPSRADGNETFIIVNRVGGNLQIGAATVGTLFGIAYDDIETPYSFSLPGTTCQVTGAISDTFPRTVPRLSQIVPAGRTGWLKIYSSQADQAILGAVIVSNPNAGAAANAFNGGRNMHKLTLSTAATFTVPVFPPTVCPFTTPGVLIPTAPAL